MMSTAMHISAAKRHSDVSSRVLCQLVFKLTENNDRLGLGLTLVTFKIRMVRSELTVSQRITGQMDHQIWMGHMGYTTCDLLTR